MHQTEGTNFNASDPDIVGRAFQQEISEVQPGSVMFAEFANAVQQEIINVLAQAAIAPEATAGADRTAGWGQMAQAIFNSASIGLPAIATSAKTKYQLFPVINASMNNGDVLVTVSNLEEGKRYRIGMHMPVFDTSSSWTSRLDLEDGAGFRLLRDEMVSSGDLDSYTASSEIIYTPGAGPGNDEVKFVFNGTNGVGTIPTIDGAIAFLSVEELPLHIVTTQWS